MKYVLKKDLVVRAGTIFNDAPKEVRHFTPHIEATIGPHKDVVISVVTSEEEATILDEYFLKLRS